MNRVDAVEAARKRCQPAATNFFIYTILRKPGADAIGGDDLALLYEYALKYAELADARDRLRADIALRDNPKGETTSE